MLIAVPDEVLIATNPLAVRLVQDATVTALEAAFAMATTEKQLLGKATGKVTP